MSFEAVSLTVVSDAALAAIAPFALTICVGRLRRPQVTLSIETDWKGPWVWTWENMGQGKPKIEHLTMTTVVPNDGHSIVIEHWGIWAAGHDQELGVDHGASGRGRIEPGEKQEWYATTETIRQLLGAAGLSGAVELRGTVQDAAGNRYHSRPLQFVV